MARKGKFAQFKDKLRLMLEESLTKHTSALNIDQFNHMVVRELEQQRSKVIWMLLGLTDKWGRWEVDTHNKSSAMINYISAQTEPLVQAWVDEALQKALSNKNAAYRRTIDRLEEHILSQLERGIQQEAWRKIDTKAKELAAQLVAELVKEVVEEGSDD